MLTQFAGLSGSSIWAANASDDSGGNPKPLPFINISGSRTVLRYSAVYIENKSLSGCKRLALAVPEVRLVPGVSFTVSLADWD